MLAALILAMLANCTQAGSNAACRLCVTHDTVELVDAGWLTFPEACQLLVERANPACDAAYPTRPPASL